MTRFSAALVFLTVLICGAVEESQAAYCSNCIPTVPSIVALQNLVPSGSQNTVAHVQGYYGPGTSGGGQFVYQANCFGTPDGGAYISVTGVPGACWARQLDPATLNQFSWGAQSAPTLVSPFDSTTQFLNMITAANPSPGGGSGVVPPPNSSVLCPAGQFWISNQLSLGQGQGLYGTGSVRSCQFNLSTTNATIQATGALNIGGTGSASIFGTLVNNAMINMNNQLGIAFYAGACQDQCGFNNDFAYQVMNGPGIFMDGTQPGGSTNTYWLGHDVVFGSTIRTAGGFGIELNNEIYPADLNDLDVLGYTGHTFADNIFAHNVFNLNLKNTTLEDNQKQFQGSQSGSVLTIITAPTGNHLSVGDAISDPGLGNIPTGSETISSFVSGSGGAGSTANVSQSASISAEAMQASSNDTNIGLLWDGAQSCIGHVDGMTTQYVPTSIEINSTCGGGASMLITGLSTNAATTSILNNAGCGPLAQTITDSIVGFYYCGNKAYFDVSNLFVTNIDLIGTSNHPTNGMALSGANQPSIYVNGALTAQFTSTFAYVNIGNLNNTLQTYSRNLSTGASAQVQDVLQNDSGLEYTLTLNSHENTGGNGIDSVTTNCVVGCYYDFNGTLEWSYQSGIQVGAATGGYKGVGTINAAGAYYANGTVGVTCSGTPTASFATVNGIVTHC